MNTVNVKVDAVKEICKEANQYRAQMTLQHGRLAVDVKSIMGLFHCITTKLAYTLHIKGEDAAEAKKNILPLLQKHKIEVSIA